MIGNFDVKDKDKCCCKVDEQKNEVKKKIKYSVMCGVMKIKGLY